MLHEIERLPRPEQRFAAGNRYGNRRRGEHRFDMRRHVIGPFDGVPVRSVIRGQGLERMKQIVPNVGVGIFLNDERRRRVPNEHDQQAVRCPHTREPSRDVRGHVMESAMPRLDMKDVLRLGESGTGLRKIGHRRP